MNWEDLKKGAPKKDNVWSNLPKQTSSGPSRISEQDLMAPPKEHMVKKANNILPLGTIVLDIETGSVDDMWSQGPEFLRLSGYSVDGRGVITTTNHQSMVDDINMLDGYIITHNGLNFDAILLAKHCGLDILELARQDRLVDTKLLAFLADPPYSRMKEGEIEKMYSLNTVGTKYLGAGKMVDVETGSSVLKTLAREFGGFDMIPTDHPQYIEYLKRDVEVTHDLVKVLEMNDYSRREHKIAAIAAMISINGFRIDRELLQQRITEGEIKRHRILTELESYGLPGPETSKSPHRTKVGKTAIEAAFFDLGVELVRTPTGQPAFGKPVLEALIESTEDQKVIDLAEAIMGLNGIRTIYGNIQEYLVGDRVHPSINLRQSSGRWSIQKPGLTVVGKRGGRAIERAVFLPDEGEILISVDLAQVDARCVAGLSQDIKYIQAFAPGRDIHGENALEILGDINLREKAKQFCVPLDSEILTKSGWKTWGQVIPGIDETMGLGDDGQLHWTPILNVNKYDDAEIIRLKTRKFDVVCTPNHKWVSDWRRGYNDSRPKYYDRVMKEAQDICSEDNLVLSAPADTGKGLDITLDEAEIIGWVLGDGSLHWSEITGATSQGTNGERRAVHLSIGQAKIDWVEHLRGLTSGWSEYGPVFKSGFGGKLGYYKFSMPAEAARDLVRRAFGELPVNKGTKHELDLDSFVLKLSSTQRESFLSGFWAAEGHMNGTQRIVTQEQGPILEAVRLAIFLDGNLPTETNHTGTCKRLQFSNPRVTGQKMTKTPEGRADVWCPTTGLGTWIMKQGSNIVITGNSHGVNYGMQAKKLAATSGMPLDMCFDFIDGFFRKFPRLAEWQDEVRLEGEISGVLYNGFGRLMKIEHDRSFTQSPALMGQSTARDILMEGILNLWKNGGEDVVKMIRGIIHDEAVLSVPEKDVAEIEQLVISSFSFEWCPIGGQYPIQIEAACNKRGRTWEECYAK